MKATKSFFFVLIIAISSCSPEKASEKAGSTEALKPTLDSLGQSILDKGEILGFAVSIDSAGRNVYSGTFGHIDSGKTQPVNEGTRFDIASVSKLIGASVIMKLKEQGKLSLDQTLDELLPDFPEKDQARKIKLHHLISHTSGLQDYAAEIDSIFMETRVVPTKSDFLAFFQGKDLMFEPGNNYQYCNSGFMMMAFIAENVTGKSWQQLIDEVVNEPTGLDFKLIKLAADLPETSPIFDIKDGEFEKVPTWVYVIGDGGLTATTRMLSAFPSHWAKENIIQQHAYEEMMTTRQLNDGTPTGYGFGVRNGAFMGEPILGHTGGWKTTYAIMCYFPQRELTFSALMNTDETEASINNVFVEFMSTLLNKSVPDYTESEASLGNSMKFTGNYHGYNDEFDEVGSMISINLQEDSNLYYCLDGYCERMYYMGNNRFWLASFPYDYMEFHTNDEGNISAFSEHYYGFFQAFRKKLDSE